jgi:twitching motility protein PilT
MQQQPKIEMLLEEVVKRDASDLHIQVGLPPMIRVDGALTAIPNNPPLTEDMIEALVFSLMDEDQKQILLRDKEFDFSFAFGDLGRFRVNAFHERGNIAAALRLIPSEIRTLEQIGMPPVLNKFTEYPRGLVLVTGPTGSGKSTTLAALVDKINTERASHIITVEDPIEYTHHSKRISSAPTTAGKGAAWQYASSNLFPAFNTGIIWRANSRRRNFGGHACRAQYYPRR